MKIIVTGGTGLIGSRLVESLSADGHELIVLSRSPEKKQGTVPAGVRLEKWDAATADGWGHLMDGADAVINLAGAGIADSRWTPERKKTILDSRVKAGKALVAAIRQAEAKPQVLVQSSAVGYYGPSGNEILTETAPPGADFLGRVCFEWEASTAAVEALGVRRPIIRTGVVISTQGGAFPKMALPFKFFAGGPIGSGEQYFPWIHIDDEVRAIRYLLENDEASGPFNLSAPEPPKNKEFVKDLGKAMGRPALMPVPSFALKAAFGEMSTVLLDGQRAVPAHLQAIGFTFAYPQTVPALRDVLQNKK